MPRTNQTLTQLYQEFEMLLNEGDANKAALVLDNIIETQAELVEICEDEYMFVR